MVIDGKRAKVEGHFCPIGNENSLRRRSLIMKSFTFHLLSLTLLVLLAACGKSNESGKKSNRYGSPYFNGQYGTYTNTPYSFAGQNVGAVLQQTPCLTTGMPTNQRMQIQFPLQGYPSVVPRGDLYVGVTTAGDVAVLVGQGNNAPLFVAYMCNRGYNGGQGSLVDLATGTQTRCAFKPLVRATLQVPGLMEPLWFRSLEGGRLNPQTGQIMPYTQPVCF